MKNENFKKHSNYLKRMMTDRKDVNLKPGEIARLDLLEDESEDAFIERFYITLRFMDLEIYDSNDLVFEKDLRFDTLQEYYTVSLSPHLQERIRKELM